MQPQLAWLRIRNAARLRCPSLHNAEATLSAAIQSILQQDFRDLELIAVDDRSSDGSVEAIATINDPRFRLVRNQFARGVVGASATGLGLASGKWFARMDASGEWLSSIMLGAVGLKGARSTVRQMAIHSGRSEGEDFWAVC